MQQTVFHDGLQDEIRHLCAAQLRVDVIVALQLRIADTHQLQICLQQLQFVVQCDHRPVDLDAQPEEIDQLHQQIGHGLVAVQLGLDADGVECIIEEVRVDLTFEIEHRELLLRQLAAQDVRVFQRQIERQRHQRQAHAADEPCVVQPL